MSPEREHFPHRQNSNETYDSICPKCFRTIDTRYVEGDLAAEERAQIHVSHSPEIIRLRVRLLLPGCRQRSYVHREIPPRRR
jgi:hypothetical protein